jgi:hypothetical protein
MTRKQLDKNLNVIKRYFRKCTETSRGLISLCYGKSMVIIGDEMLEHYIELIEKQCNDNGENISWYIFDNNFGNNKRSRNGVVIDNTRKLLNLIEKENMEKKL